MTNHWNHRIIRTTEEGAASLAIHEVHYEAGTPVEHTEAVIVDGDSIQELRDQLASMGRALDLPVLTEADFGRVRPLVVHSVWLEARAA